jgi:hypothetical protein
LERERERREVPGRRVAEEFEETQAPERHGRIDVMKHFRPAKFVPPVPDPRPKNAAPESCARRRR